MAFDYKGYSEETLLALCDSANIDAGNAEWVYWTAEVYSFGRHIRDYAFYPSFLPLLCFTDHGAGTFSHMAGIPKHEFESTAPVQFYHSPDVVNVFKKVSEKLCFCMFSPFVWYRKKNDISQSPTAKGTLAFPAHTTPSIDLTSDIEEYIEQLKTLPEQYHPVCVCLHMHDIVKGQHKLFLKHGIPVYTAGNTSDYRFAERWYDLVKNFKYTTSNMIGSYTYYAVEMGIPFFIYGDAPELTNHSDDNLSQGCYNYQTEEYIKICDIFKDRYEAVTETQKELVEKHLGIHDGISRLHMAKLLYASYCKSGRCFQDAVVICKRLIKAFLRLS